MYMLEPVHNSHLQTTIFSLLYKLLDRGIFGGFHREVAYLYRWLIRQVPLNVYGKVIYSTSCSPHKLDVILVPICTYSSGFYALLTLSCHLS